MIAHAQVSGGGAHQCWTLLRVRFHDTGTLWATVPGVVCMCVCVL
jgi:hypothetical protein